MKFHVFCLFFFLLNTKGFSILTVVSGHRLLEWLNPEPLNSDPDAVDVVSFLISSWTWIDGIATKSAAHVTFANYSDVIPEGISAGGHWSYDDVTIFYCLISLCPASWLASGGSKWSQEEWDSGALCPPSWALHQPGWCPHHWCSPLGKQEWVLFEPV